MTKEEIPIRSTLYALEVGGKVLFPASQFNSVSVSATNYGFQLGRRFTVRKLRDTKQVEVTRTE